MTWIRVNKHPRVPVILEDHNGNVVANVVDAEVADKLIALSKIDPPDWSVIITALKKAVRDPSNSDLVNQQYTHVRDKLVKMGEEGVFGDADVL